MFDFFYQAVLMIGWVVMLPWVLWQRLRFGKYKKSLPARLGFFFPDFSRKESSIWIHCVSVGEVKAVSSFYNKIRKEYEAVQIVISTTTETGLAEAKKTIPFASGYFFLPYDFSWTMKKIFKFINPKILILSEGDLWWNMLRVAKKNNTATLLVNGKMSQRSADRMQKFGAFSKRILRSIDLFCLQSSEYQERFIALGVDKEKTCVTGNLKLSQSHDLLTNEKKRELRKKLSINNHQKVLVIASTHHPEEKMLLDQLKEILEDHKYKILLVPRHPERFIECENVLKQKGIAYAKYSHLVEGTYDANVVLIDAMGVLADCYQISDLAIVAGSFIPKIGGHNIFEPILLGVPTVFGSYMHSQKDLAQLAISLCVAKQLPIEQVNSFVKEYFSNEKMQNEYRLNCLKAGSVMQNSLETTWNFCEEKIKNVFF